MKPKTYLFPASSTAGAPTNRSRPRRYGMRCTKQRSAPESKKGVSAHAAPQLRHASAGTWDRPAAPSRCCSVTSIWSHDRLPASIPASFAGVDQSPEDLPISRLDRRSRSRPRKQRMTRPTVEVADIFRAQGKLHRSSSNRIGFQQLKVMRAIERCRTAALGGHIDKCLRLRQGLGPSPLTHAETGIVPSVRLKRASAGSPPGNGNCWRPLLPCGLHACRMS